MDMNQLQLNAVLVNPLTDFARKLQYTHQLSRPVEEIRSLIYGKTEGIPKMRLFSAHDDNIANILTLIHPTYNWYGIPYAANIQFELWRKGD